MATLTRDEARTRAGQLQVHTYTIDLDFTRGDTTFASTTTVRFATRPDATNTEAATDTFIEIRPHTLHRATLDGHDLDPGTLVDGRLPLTGLTPGDHELTVLADMPYSHTGEGMHRFTDPADGLTYLYSMCCMTDSPLVYAAFDQPDLKATFDVTVTAPEDWTVLGNGIATPVAGAPGRWRCATTPPISTYLMAVAAGPYHSVRTEHAGLPFGIHVRRSLAPHLDRDADEILGITRALYDRYADILDEPYPFDSYDQAFVPEFNAGAMENPGLVTLRDEYIYRSAVTDTQRQLRGVVIAHEMAHMWFGDLVTLRWWDDIWLNESFAEFMGYQTLADAVPTYTPWTEFAVDRKAWGYDADQRPTTHPVAPEPDGVPDTASAWLNFDGISYAKGASALRQLVTWLGQDTFLAGVNDHFARHRFGNATLADFIDAMARASGRDVHAWADAWLRTSGPDLLTPDITQNPAPDTNWTLTLHHQGNRPHRLRIGTYDGAQHRATHDIELTADQPTTTLTAPGNRPDLLIVNDGDLTYAKVRLDPHSWTTAQHVLSQLPDPLSRTVVWNAARDMVRDAELPPHAYLEAARRHLPTEPETAIVESVIAFATTQITDRYLAGEEPARTEALALLTELATDLAHHATQRQDDAKHLIAQRTAIRSATGEAPLRTWLADDTAGRDPELRWQILYRLATLGATDETEIRAEAERDPSAKGEEGAARCLAALPDPQAKATAWHALFDPADTLSNYLFTATAQGFWQPEERQRDLLRPYVERYFPAAAAVATRRGHALAVATARHAFPHPFTDHTTLTLAEAALREPLPPALHRKLTDETDDLRRALHVRERPWA
ncbi:aminopeptidase N [Streptomyces sp. XM4011]|uniref:aminopeptidase N n=1 Tax=Streptomyces sp. XM4011 TaxID=2929780 RepID=UPI001FF9ACE3|nr:aminopeptidase N [Streptomyces sp. XM4011]MCK1817395.1 aminopeptidase N [Streptomyces sp. XM4011]